MINDYVLTWNVIVAFEDNFIMPSVTYDKILHIGDYPASYLLSNQRDSIVQLFDMIFNSYTLSTLPASNRAIKSFSFDLYGITAYDDDSWLTADIEFDDDIREDYSLFPDRSSQSSYAVKSVVEEYKQEVQDFFNLAFGGDYLTIN